MPGLGFCACRSMRPAIMGCRQFFDAAQLAQPCRLHGAGVLGLNSLSRFLECLSVAGHISMQASAFPDRCRNIAPFPFRGHSECVSMLPIPPRLPDIRRAHQDPSSVFPGCFL